MTDATPIAAKARNRAYHGLLIALLAACVTWDAAPQERTGDPAKWRTYWNALMPVFTHPRCLNCHGGTDPRAGDNHGGGPAVEDLDFECIGCHTANTAVVPGRCGVTPLGTIINPSDGEEFGQTCVAGEEQGEMRVSVGRVWTDLGPSFVGLGPRELCLEVKMRMGPERLLAHAEKDALIGFAFQGTKAIDGQSPFAPADAEPPPMDRAAFVDILRRWITEAAMACSTDGTVVLTDTLEIDTMPSARGSTSLRNSVNATIEIKTEVATSEVRYDDRSKSALEAAVPGCNAKVGVDVQSTAQGRPPVTYEIEMGPGGVYRMRFLVGTVDAETRISSTEELCRPKRRRQQQAPVERITELRFGVENQQAQRGPSDPSLWILKGSTTVPNDDFAAAGVRSGGEQMVTWDIVIR